MTPGVDRRQFMTGAVAVTGVAALPTALGAGAALAAPPAGTSLPERGIYDTTAAAAWTDGFLSGNGEYGAIFYGTPGTERVIVNHHRFVLPNGTRDLTPPVLSGRLDQIRDMCLAGDYSGAQSAFPNGWALRYTQSFHPGYELVVTSPANTTVSNYVRTTDFATGEVGTAWTDSAGGWRRRGFVSRPDRVIVHELQPAPGHTVDLTVSVNAKLAGVPSTVAFTTLASVSNGSGYLNLRGTYPANQGAYGYEGVTRVVVTGGQVAASGASITVTAASRVLLLTGLARYHSAGGWNAQTLQSTLGAISAGYDTLLARHTGVHGPIYARSRLDLNVSTADRQLSTSELIARQNANPGTVDTALLERMYDSGRYHFLSSSGILPPRLTGLWAGSWDAAWADDFTTDANVNLQIAGGTILDLGEGMQAYFNLILGQLADWRVNARNAYAARGLLAPTRTDGEDGHLFHFADWFPGEVFISGADWLLYPLLEYYEVTGDPAFLRDKLGPALIELALFYEDFLTRTDSAGKVIFVPSYSPENNPGNSTAAVSVNATIDIAAGRHALQAAVDAADTLGLEQGSGGGVARWRSLLSRLPAYRVNAQGGLTEWAWPSLTDRQNHRHVSHLYPAWPLYEINPEERPVLVAAARRALELRGDENLSAHGSLHRALAAARLKDGAQVYTNVRKVLGNKMVYRSLMTSHNPNLTTYNSDAANTLPAILAEALVTSRPGLIELLPAVPAELGRGSITGVRGRNRVRVDKLSWDLPARTVVAILRSEIDQTTTLASRRGIAVIQTAAPLAPAPAGERARLITLTAGQPVEVSITLPATATQYLRLVSRRSGKVMDIAAGSADDGGKVVQNGWTGAFSQQWQLLANNDDTFRLINRASGRLLEVPGGTTTIGTQLDQWQNSNAAHQWWRLAESAAAGHHALVNARTGLSADVTGASTADGAAVIQWTASATADNQQWQLLPA